LFKVLLETLGPEEHIPTALLLLADKGKGRPAETEKKKKDKDAMAEFAADLLNSFPLTARLIVCLCWLC
jgi:hypothetical protein